MLTSSHSRSICSDAPVPSSVAPATHLTTTAWSPEGDLTVASWVRHGRWLGAIGRGSGWWIGDWVRYGSARYGERYLTAGEVTGYDLHSLRNMAYVAGRFERPRRRESLSFSHHAELAGLATEEQELWLDRAEAGEWSVGTLRAELRHTRRRAASRAALAEARHQRDRAIASMRPRGPAYDREREAPNDAGGTRAAGRATAASALGGETSPGASSAGVEVICPECGCHFDTPADRKIPQTGEPTRRPGSAAPLVGARAAG
jgi:hypothetical protein